MKTMTLLLFLLLDACDEGNPHPALQCGVYEVQGTWTCSAIEKESRYRFDIEHRQAIEIKDLHKELEDALHAQFVCESKLGKRP